MPFFRSQTPFSRGRKRSTDLLNLDYFSEKGDDTSKGDTLYETTDRPRELQRDDAQNGQQDAQDRQPYHSKMSNGEPDESRETNQVPVSEQLPETGEAPGRNDMSEPQKDPGPPQNPIGAVLNAPNDQTEPATSSNVEGDDEPRSTTQDEAAHSTSTVSNDTSENKQRPQSRADTRKRPSAIELPDRGQQLNMNEQTATKNQPPGSQMYIASTDQAGVTGDMAQDAPQNEAENGFTDQPDTPAYRGFDPLSIATSPGNYHISSEDTNAQGYFGSEPAGRKESTGQSIAVNLNLCRAGKLNRRGKPTVGKPKQQIRDYVILPDTKSYTEIGGFLVGRVEVRYGIKLPIEDIKAIALTKGKPGEGVEIVDDETWRAARKMMARGERGGGEEQTKDASGREADLELCCSILVDSMKTDLKSTLMADATDSPPEYSPASSPTTGPPVIINLNHCTPGPPNSRCKVTVGKLIESIPDIVVLPDTDTYRVMSKFIIQRAEKRFAVKLPVPETLAIALTQGNPQDGKRVLIVDDESWQGARALLRQQGGEEKALAGGKARKRPRKGEVRMEMWFVTETVQQLEKRDVKQQGCASM
ncbi:hypothetical protein Tdes44962_MAKER07597 [Teratosphaeria destructans]|uniref:Uncharacterized protein n=1 Tax=Teratosphaeria destructans TaxID=418781 RepID=A0A9W7SYZ5_9PEZI|nr:hypothetical protein Tdes44962_MAKER07597 [Teratosphaeria destructans]